MAAPKLVMTEPPVSEAPERRESRPADPVPAVSLCVDLIAWFVPLLHKLPRDYRFTLGDRMENRMLDLLEHLLRATYDRRARVSALFEANLTLDVLRHLWRLCRQFKLVDARRHEHGSRLLVGIGEQVGGWLKASRGPSPAGAGAR
jgi:hypothetical protein